MNKELFLRKDYKTYKPKFKLLCPLCEFNIKKFAPLENKDYICRIKIISI